jgi:hypothetical protein
MFRCRSASVSNQPEALSIEYPMAASMPISEEHTIGPAAATTKKRKKNAATTKREKKKDGAAEKPKETTTKPKELQALDSPAISTRSKKVLLTTPSMSTRSKRRLTL